MSSSLGSGRLELFIRTKNTRGALLVFAQIGGEVETTSSRQSSTPACIGMRTRVRIAVAAPKAWGVELSRGRVDRFGTPGDRAQHGDAVRRVDEPERQH